MAKNLLAGNGNINLAEAPLKEKIQHPQRAKSLFSRMKNLHVRPQRKFLPKTHKFLNSFYNKLLPTDLLETEKARKMFSYRKYHANEYFYLGQKLEFFREALKQGYAGTEADFVSEFSKCSLYFKRHYQDKPELLLVVNFKGEQYVGFQYINPDGSKGGFLNIGCHFHEDASSVCIDEKSLILGAVIFENGVRISNSKFFRSGRYSHCDISDSELSDCTVVPADKQNPKISRISSSECEFCDISSSTISQSRLLGWKAVNSKIQHCTATDGESMNSHPYNSELSSWKMIYSNMRNSRAAGGESINSFIEDCTLEDTYFYGAKGNTLILKHIRAESGALSRKNNLTFALDSFNGRLFSKNKTVSVRDGKARDDWSYLELGNRHGAMREKSRTEKKNK